MKCYYHQDRDVVGMCVACGKPVCLECKVIMKDRIYCNQCIDGGKAKVVYETGSWAWWFLPTLLGIFGGIIAYLLTKKKNPIRSSDYLIVGTILTLSYIFLQILNGILYD